MKTSSQDKVNPLHSNVIIHRAKQETYCKIPETQWTSSDQATKYVAIITIHDMQEKEI